MGDAACVIVLGLRGRRNTCVAESRANTLGRARGARWEVALRRAGQSVLQPASMDARLLDVARGCKGYLDEAEGLRLYELARQYGRLGPIVEIGSYCGKSSVYLGAGAKAAGTQLICVDHHRGSEEHQLGQEYHDPELYDAAAGQMDTLHALRRTLRLAGLEDVCIPLVTRSATAAQLWAAGLGMLFIDGGHSFEAAHLDYDSWHRKLSPGGVLAIHDLFPDPTQGGQAPIEIYRKGLASGLFDALPTTKTLGVLQRR
jgi:predicted O-methyltransferase YrrM